MKVDIQYLKDRGLIVFEAIMGSFAYGTNTPESDVDIRGIYVQDLDSILGMGYVEQVSDDKNDITYYEIRRFVELVRVNNPNIIELLNVPKDCIRVYNPVMDVILANANQLLTKKCKSSFGAYAMQQIRKARGLNKMMNWEDHEMVRKSVLDFCYVIRPDGNGTVPFEEFLAELRLDYPNKYLHTTQKSFGLSKIDHAEDCYNIYFIEGEPTFKTNPNYAGVVYDLEKSNNVHLTSFSKDCPFVATMTFNVDAYSTHCTRYSSYQEWLKNRNQKRVDMNRSHGKKYDGKNMMHCVRLLTMANEIAEGKGVVVRRSPDEVNKLLSIKRGEYDYEDILKEAESLVAKMEKTYPESNLPDEIKSSALNDMLVRIRREFYGMARANWYVSDWITLRLDDIVTCTISNTTRVEDTRLTPSIDVTYSNGVVSRILYATHGQRDMEYREISKRLVRIQQTK